MSFNSFKLAILFVILALLFITAFEGDGPIRLLRRIKCKLGLHRSHIGRGKLKVNKYYCQNCKKPRIHPNLSLLEGGNKMGNYKYSKGERDGK